MKSVFKYGIAGGVLFVLIYLIECFIPHSIMNQFIANIFETGVINMILLFILMWMAVKSRNNESTANYFANFIKAMTVGFTTAFTYGFVHFILATFFTGYPSDSFNQFMTAFIFSFILSLVIPLFHRSKSDLEYEVLDDGF